MFSLTHGIYRKKKKVVLFWKWKWKEKWARGCKKKQHRQ